MEWAQPEWERFCRTGLVRDYLAYCQARQAVAGCSGRDEEFDNEDHDRRNRQPGSQFSG